MDIYHYPLDVRLMVATGGSLELVAAQTPVAEMPLARRHSYLFFNASAGQEYQIGVLGEPQYAPWFRMELSQTAPPMILRHPADKAISRGQSILLRVASARLSGAPANGFQWQFNGLDLPGQNRPLLPLHNVGEANAGEYRVLVSAAAEGGTTLVRTSRVARLSIREPDLPLRLSLSREGSNILVHLNGEIGQEYTVHSSDDPLLERPPLPSGPTSIGFSSFPLVLPLEGKMFFRATRRVSPVPACNLNLGEFYCARQLWAADHRKPLYGAYDPEAIREYLSPGEHLCPADGTYSIGENIDELAYCTEALHQTDDYAQYFE